MGFELKRDLWTEFNVDSFEHTLPSNDPQEENFPKIPWKIQESLVLSEYPYNFLSKLRTLSSVYQFQIISNPLSTEAKSVL